MPIVVVADWLLEPARHRLPVWTAAVWLTYPLAWFAYTLTRGPSASWYPYPFVDVASHGYGRVLLNAAIFTLCFAGARVRARPRRQLAGRCRRTDSKPRVGVRPGLTACS